MPADIQTPMMRQYWSIKKSHPDSLLFYRMGDFYELFFDDARRASDTLKITLTTRGKHRGEDVPMCGVPVHSADDYLLKLIRAGHRVAVCEQTEDPEEARKRGKNSVVRREVVRVVTPGTLTEDSLLDAQRNNFLAAWIEIREDSAFSWLDLSTGEFRVSACPRSDLTAAVSRVAPRELLLPDRICDDREIVSSVREEGASPTPLGPASFNSNSARTRLERAFGVASLEPYGDFSRSEISAMGAIIDYVEMTQRGMTALIRPPVREASGERMGIDPATRRNLEIVETLSGTRAGSLLDATDRTVTGTGARLLAARLAAPSTELAVIAAQHDAVAFFQERRTLAGAVTGLLRGLPDLERAMARLALGRGGPRDLGAVRSALETAAAIEAKLAGEDGPTPVSVARARADLAGHGELHSLLAQALAESLPTAVADGSFIAAGHLPELDQARELRDTSVDLIAELQKTCRDRTGVASLRIKHNNVLGYFIEVRDKHGSKLRSPEHEGAFIHRQTISSAERFTTAELSELEGRIAGARARAIQIETEAFEMLCTRVLAAGDALAALAAALAEIDLAAALGSLAAEQGWTRPEMTDDLSLVIEGGRHPVVEQALARTGGQAFCANDCDLTADSPDTNPLWILTGPNMAGKSTFLRQNALIAVLAQAGSFVPARRARIGIVDRLFSRVGAADDLARGRSTFMVEMVETAAILHQAGPRSLVILDEIGRGTATYDGMSIAWAVIEHLRMVNRSRVLFATHFHELTELASRLEGVCNASVRVKEWEGELVFLHEVTPGVADRSYGVQVARLAGLPPQVTARAGEILARLEAEDGESGKVAAISSLPLFDAAAPTKRPAAEEVLLLEEICAVEPDRMTPLEALETLYRIRAMAARIRN